MIEIKITYTSSDEINFILQPLDGAAPVQVSRGVHRAPTSVSYTDAEDKAIHEAYIQIRRSGNMKIKDIAPRAKAICPSLRSRSDKAIEQRGRTANLFQLTPDEYFKDD